MVETAIKEPLKEGLVEMIVPMYNAAEHLQQCLESIASQTHRDFIVMLIDDESTDETLSIARQFASHDSRFRVVRLPHGGVSAARNFGIDHSRARYIGFVDADDCLHPYALERMLRTIRQTDADVCVCAMERGVEYTPVAMEETPAEVFDYSEAMSKALYQQIILNSPCGMLMERSLLDDDLRFREGIRYEDLDAFYRFYDGASAIAYLPEKLYFYRQHPASFMHSWNPARLDVLDVTDRIVEYMAIHHPDLVGAAEDRRFSAHFNMLLLMLAYKVDNKGAIDRCREVIRRGRFRALLDPHVRLKNKLGALLSLGGTPILKLFARKDR